MNKVLVGLAMPALLAGTIIATSQFAAADDSEVYKQTFQAQLKGSEEVPAVATTSSGDATFQVRQDERQVDYVVRGSNIQGAVMGHVHCGAKGQNGPVIIPLFESSPTDINGVLAEGSLSTEDILPAAANCSPNIQTMPQFVQAMREGKLYVNVHTTKFPNGVVRGQLAESANTPSDNDNRGEAGDSKLFATANPDGIDNDAIVGISNNLQKATDIINDFPGITSIQSIQFDDDDKAYVTFDAANMTGGVLTIDDIKTSTTYDSLSGADTGLVAPKGIEVIDSRDAIIVSDNGAKDIKVFADDATGNTAPLFRANLGQSANNARSIWDTSYDRQSDTLFAAGTDGVVMVYDDFFATKGIDGPTKFITPSDNQSNKLSVNLHGIVYVPERDSLLLSDVGSATSATDGQVFTINNVKQASGRTETSYRLSGADTRLGNPVDITYDGQHLFVAEKSNDRVLQFNDIFGRNGNQNQAANFQVTVTKPESVDLY